MKHAGAAALAGLEGLLAALRARPGLVEKKPGIFYRKGQAFAHFHEDAAGMFGDLRTGAEWERFAVNGAVEEAAFLAAVDGVLGGRLQR
jgi:hypothetical protein